MDPQFINKELKGGLLFIQQASSYKAKHSSLWAGRGGKPDYITLPGLRSPEPSSRPWKHRAEHCARPHSPHPKIKQTDIFIFYKIFQAFWISLSFCRWLDLGMHLKSHSQKQQQNRNSHSGITPPSLLNWPHKWGQLPRGTNFHSQFYLYTCNPWFLTIRMPLTLMIALPVPSDGWQMCGPLLLSALLELGSVLGGVRVCSLGFPSLSFPGGPVDWQHRGPAGQLQNLGASRQGQRQWQQQQRQQLIQWLREQLRIRLRDREQFQRERGHCPLLQPRGKTCTGSWAPPLLASSHGLWGCDSQDPCGHHPPGRLSGFVGSHHFPYSAPPHSSPNCTVQKLHFSLSKKLYLDFQKFLNML